MKHHMENTHVMMMGRSSMHNKTCAVCGKEIAGGVGIGGVFLCTFPCAEEVREEMDKLRAEGQPVSVPKIALAIYRDKHSVASYTLRDIPSDLWQAAKHYSVDHNISLRELIIEALRERVKE